MGRTARPRSPCAGTRSQGDYVSWIARGANRGRLAGGTDRGHLRMETTMAKESFHGPLEQIDECCWRIPKSYKPGMRVDGLIFASEQLLPAIVKDQAPDQVANVAFLPGIQHASLAMPDIHWGYGFPIGGVCATDPDEGGVISPGGVGYDINCGVRLMRTNLSYREAKPHVRTLVESLFRQIPTGVGKSGRFQFRGNELDQLLAQGSRYLTG